MSEQLVGRTLGPYHILEQLGIGGMATVYKAHQTNMDRYVAIKVLPRHFAHDPTFVGRFQQEAKVIARLEHARILPVFDYGEEDGITYLVMRFLPAGTLAEQIHQGPMDLDDIARIMTQIGEGLDYAHKRGVIHRDIKPSNIMLDESGDAYITDFGISKLVEGTAQFTGSGIVGTPAYLSPEQGLGQAVDHRTDIYSLGVMLYQMATGHVPYSAETPMAIVIKHINEPLPSPRSMNPDIPEQVEAVIMRAMAKDPTHRYQTAGELAKALQQAVAEAIPAHRAATIPSDHTAIKERAHREAQTVPLSAAAGVAAAAAESPGAAAPPEKRRRPRWLVIAGAVIGLCVCSFLALVVVSNAGERAEQRQATQTAQAAGAGSAGDGEATGEASPTDPFVVAENTQAVGAEAGIAPLPGGSRPGIGCPPEMRSIWLFDFESADQLTPLGEHVTLEVLEDGRHVLALTPDDTEVGQNFGEAVADSAFAVQAIFPAGPTEIVLGIRVTGEQTYYAAVFTTDGKVVLARGQTPLIEPVGVTASIYDGLPHRLVISVVGSRVTVFIDGQEVAEATDAEPLPAGVFGVLVREHPVYLDAVALCGIGDAPGNVAFEDRFEAEGLKPEWRWSREPGADAWRLSDGRLGINMQPGTGLGSEPPLMLAVPAPERAYQATVFVDVVPTTHGQGAGLVIFSNDGHPLATLVRAACIGDEPDCQGDAIYFTRWERSAGGEQTNIGQHMAAAGALPVGGMIGLRLVEDGGSLRGMYSLDGVTWHDVGTLPLRNVRIGGIGLMAVGGAAAEAVSAWFDDFLLLIQPGG